MTTIGTLVIDVFGSNKRSDVVWSCLHQDLSIVPFGVGSLSSVPADSVSTPRELVLSKVESEFSAASFAVISFISTSPDGDSCGMFSVPFLSAPGPLMMFPYKSVSVTEAFFPFSTERTRELVTIISFPAPPF